MGCMGLLVTAIKVGWWNGWIKSKVVKLLVVGTKETGVNVTKSVFCTDACCGCWTWTCNPDWLSSCLGNGCCGKETTFWDVDCLTGFLGYFFFGFLFLKWTLWTCSRILSFRPELWLQNSHLKGLSALWTVAMCLFILSLRPKQASHNEQPNGFSL